MKRLLFALMLVFEGKGRLIADFSRAEILDGTGVHVAGVHSPVIAHGCELEEGCAIETYESLLDHGLHLAVAALHVHHHGDGYTAGNPLHRRFGEVAYRRHVAGDTCLDETRGIEAESVAVVGIEV